jgi:hypothetical protein
MSEPDFSEDPSGFTAWWKEVKEDQMMLAVRHKFIQSKIPGVGQEVRPSTIPGVGQAVRPLNETLEHVESTDPNQTHVTTPCNLLEENAKCVWCGLYAEIDHHPDYPHPGYPSCYRCVLRWEMTEEMKT